MGAQAAGAAEAIDVMVPEKDAPDLAAGCGVGPEVPGKYQAEDERHSPPKPETVHQARPRPQSPGRRQYPFAEKVNAESNGRQHDSDGTFQQQRAGESQVGKEE